MIVSDHTSKVFDADLIKLTQKVAEMGGFAQKQITDAMEALARRDLVLAHQVVAADAMVDDMQRQIEEKAVETIALRQPMAIDLRAIVAMLRIANDLERIGDLAKNIGKRAIAMGNQPSQRTWMRGCATWRRLRSPNWPRCSTASSAAARSRRLKSGRATRISTRFTCRCSANCSPIRLEDPGSISMCIHLLFCAKNIERIGDHATNIAEAVHYMVEGHPIEGDRPKGDTSSYTS